MEEPSSSGTAAGVDRYSYTDSIAQVASMFFLSSVHFRFFDARLCGPVTEGTLCACWSFSGAAALEAAGCSRPKK